MGTKNKKSVCFDCAASEICEFKEDNMLFCILKGKDGSKTVKNADIYREKLANAIDGIYNHFDKKQVKRLKIEFISFVCTKALERTNKELFGLGLNKLGFYDKNRDLYPDEYNKALNIFGKHFQEILENIVIDIVNGIKEVK